MPVSPPRIYLDTNVLIAFLGDEEGRADVVQSILDDARDQRVDLLTSTFSIAEVAYISYDSDVERADDEALIDLLWVPASPLTLIDVSEAVTRAARSVIRLARTTQSRRVQPADAIHLASADIHGCDQFFTYEKLGTQELWNELVEPIVGQPFTDAPRLPL